MFTICEPIIGLSFGGDLQTNAYSDAKAESHVNELLSAKMPASQVALEPPLA